MTAVYPLDIQFGVKVSDYKCFVGDPQGFDQICRINVIIGRNNTGKSALLDLIEQATKGTPTFTIPENPRAQSPSLVWTLPVTEDVARRFFHEGTSGGGINGNHWNVGETYVGQSITFHQPNNTDVTGRVVLSFTTDHSSQYI